MDARVVLVSCLIGIAASAGAVEPAGRSPVVGLWHGIGKYQIAQSGRLQSGSAGRTILFRPDGTYVSELPYNGVTDATIAALSPYYHGTYRVEGAQVTLKTAVSSAQPDTYVLANGILKGRGAELTRRPSVEGARIDGTFFVDGAPNRGLTISFSSDGRFVDGGGVGSAQSGVRGGASAGSGSYDVVSQTINFRYRDGRKVSLTVFAIERDELLIARARLRRQ